MKVLSVASGIPYPPDDGTRLRTWHFLSRVASEHHVTLLTWGHQGEDQRNIAKVRESIQEVHVGTIRGGSPSIGSRAWVRMRSMATGIPPYVIEKLRRYPAHDVDDDFDIAVAEDDAALFLMPEVRCPVVIHRHNIFSDTITQLRDSGQLGAARRFKWSLELPMWRKFDADLSKRADLSVVTTPESGERLKRLVPDSRVEVIGNGVHVPARRLIPSSDPVAVFIGTMDYEPNADAVVGFVRKVWPRVRESIPGAELRVIGRRPMKQVRALAGEGVKVLGDVPDIVAACNGARVGVVPLNAGSGIKNKTIELMAMGLPVMTSTNGGEGIRAERRDGFFKVTSDVEAASALIELLSPATDAVHLGAAAREVVASQFSWDASAERFCALLSEVVERSTVGAPE